MKIGLDSYSVRFQRWSTLELLQNAHKLGFSKISVSISELFNADPNKILMLGEEIQRLGIDLSITGLPLVSTSVNKELNRQEVIKKTLTLFTQSLKLCHQLKAKYFRTFILEEYNSDLNPQELFEEADFILGSLVPLLKEVNTTLVIENHKESLSSELLHFISTFDEEYVGICFDFGNQIAVSERPCRALETLSSRIKMCHMKDIAIKRDNDGYYWRAVPLGKGCLPLLALFRRIKQLMIQEVFLEISTSRAPTFVQLTENQRLSNPILQEFWEFVLSEGRWLSEVDHYVCREEAPVDRIAKQEILHLEESLNWSHSNLGEL